MALAALEMRERLDALHLQPAGSPLQMRIGIHTGNVVAGIIGRRKFSYDLWGDTVNTAARMESHSAHGRIQCSERVYQLLKGQFEFEERDMVEIKSKGLMRTYFLEDRKDVTGSLEIL